MVDIIIYPRNNKATIIAGQTDKGIAWMRENYRSTTTTIPIDVLEDFKKDLTDLKLTFEDL